MTPIFLKQKDIKPLREKLYNKNNKKCALTKLSVSLDEIVLDHIHKTKAEEISINKGSIRNSISSNANCFLGKIENAYKRYLKNTGLSIVECLELTKEYIERGAYIEDNNYYIHPREVPKEPILMKSSYNILKKINPKIPPYPKSKKLTKDLKLLFQKYNIEPILKYP